MAGSLTRDGGADELEEAHEINVTPFIDVMLVLLIIFMIAAPLATVDVAVDLPGSTAQPAPRPADPIYLTVREDLSLALGEDAVGREALGPALDGAAEGDKAGAGLPAGRPRRRLRRPDGGDEPAADRRLPQAGAGGARAAARDAMTALVAESRMTGGDLLVWGAAGAAALAAHAALAALLLREPPVAPADPAAPAAVMLELGADADRAGAGGVAGRARRRRTGAGARGARADARAARPAGRGAWRRPT